MQGHTAGVNMAGGNEVFGKAIPMNSIGFFGLHIMTAGTYEGEMYEEKRREICERCNEVLNFSIPPILGALSLLSNHSFYPILDNILGKGLPEMQRKILFSKEEGKSEP